jgi:hypothetical protein
MSGQHTPPGEPGANGAWVIERKQKPDGSVAEFRVQLAHAEPGVMVVRFIVPPPGGRPGMPVHIPAGTVSDGYFWADRPYNVYRMRAPDGSLVAHRWDAVTAVELTDEGVTYRDLAWDWWLLPDGTLVEEDGDEYEALLAAGLLSEADIAAAERAVKTVRASHFDIAEECRILERRWGLK